MAGKRILVVDDDRGILRSFKEILEPEGYSVDTAETGADALAKCRSHSYNLAVIDVKLQDIEGIQLLPKIHEILPKARTIIITGYPSLENAVQSVNEQADAYLIKPVNPETFLRVVADNIDKQLEVEKVTEEKVVSWVETRCEETRRNRSKRKLLAPEQLRNAED